MGSFQNHCNQCNVILWHFAQAMLVKTQEVLMIDVVQSNIAYSSVVYTLTMA
jgi:translation initiation factor 6 (eIF-6)